MTDQEYADTIRQKLHELYDLIADARHHGLEVAPPVLIHQWLLTGHAPGEPEAWIIKRHSL